MTLGFELLAEQFEIVDLAVEDERDARTLMHHGLDARRQIDDRQPPMRRARRGMSHRPCHPGRCLRRPDRGGGCCRPSPVNRRSGSEIRTLKYEAGYTAHVVVVALIACRGR